MSAFDTIKNSLTVLPYGGIDYRVGFVEVNAELAQALLDEANKRNRPLGNADVKKYAVYMVTGEWEINGETLVFDNKNHLVNGQHRLHAVIEAATTQQGIDADFSVTFLVVCGVKPKAFDTFDQGRARKLADVLAVDGEDHAKHLAAALRFLHNRLAGRGAGAGGKFTTFSAKQTLKEHQGLITALEYFLGNKESSGLQAATETDENCETTLARLTGSLAHMGVLRYLQIESGADEALINDFWRGLAFGVDLSDQPLAPDDPRKRLRVTLAKSNEGTSKLSRDARIGVMVKAWLAFEAGETLSKLSIGKGEIPRLPGLDSDSQAKPEEAPESEEDAESPVKEKIAKKKAKKKAKPIEEAGADEQSTAEADLEGGE